jgi:hypothetical protein
MDDDAKGVIVTKWISSGVALSPYDRRWTRHFRE